MYYNHNIPPREGIIFILILVFLCYLIETPNYFINDYKDWKVSSFVKADAILESSHITPKSRYTSEEYITIWNCGKYGQLVCKDKDVFKWCHCKSKLKLEISSTTNKVRIVGLE